MIVSELLNADRNFRSKLSLAARMNRAAAFLLLLIVGGCHEHGPPAPTAEQSQQLNDAEDMLNGMAANEEGPADRSASPSNNSAER